MSTRLALALAIFLAACGDDDGAPDPAVVAACDACLAGGGSFTGGQCATDCLQDTYCFGPANPSAPTCSRDPADYDSDPI
jgi:hypothetical protein